MNTRRTEYTTGGGESRESELKACSSTGLKGGIAFPVGFRESVRKCARIGSVRTGEEYVQLVEVHIRTLQYGVQSRVKGRNGILLRILKPQVNFERIA